MSNIDIIYIMGVSGCGKSTIGSELSKSLSWSFKDGDSFHPPENIAKMHSGRPLTDSDRFPWLRCINSFARSHPKHVIACSSLRKSYREVLSDGVKAMFFLLNIEKEILEKRVSYRPGHFMPPDLLESQLATLEFPGIDESNVIIIDAGDKQVEEIVRRILEKL